MLRPACVRLLIGVAAVFLTACGGDAGGAAEPAPTVPPAQAASLADGIVTPAEYEQAVLATISCQKDAGLVTTEPMLEDGLIPQWSWEMTAPSEDLLEQGSACEREFLERIQGAWVTQNEPSEAEYNAAREAALACLRERGIDAPDFATLQAMREDFSPEQHSAYAECTIAHLR